MDLAVTTEALQSSLSSPAAEGLLADPTLLADLLADPTPQEAEEVDAASTDVEAEEVGEAEG